MPPETSIAEHWADRDVYGLIVSALERASKSLDSLTVEELAPVDHFHARGFPATIDLADRLPVKPGDHLLDIGCGVGGPARYFAQRFGCKVSGIDITGPFVEAANKLTALLGVIPTTGPTDAATEDLVHEVRDRVAGVNGAAIWSLG